MIQPHVQVIIVSHNTKDLTLRAVGSALGSTGVVAEVLVVDNASSDDTCPALRSSYPSVNVISMDQNLGFGRAVNVALEKTAAPYVLLLNSDAALVDSSALHKLVDALRHRPDVGAVGPLIKDLKGNLHYSVRVFPSISSVILRMAGLHRLLTRKAKESLLASEFGDYGRSHEAQWITGACMLVRREVFDQVGGFDPKIFLYGEELEWYWRAHEKGWKTLFLPDVQVLHEGGASGGSLGTRKFHLAMAGDAYAVRKHRGSAYFVVYWWTRLGSLLFEMVFQAVGSVVSSNKDRWHRARRARDEIATWIRVIRSTTSEDDSGYETKLPDEGVLR